VIRRTLSLALLAASAAAFAPAAHAGCAETYLLHPDYYVGPAIENPVSTGGGVVSVDTNAARADAKNVTLFAGAVAGHESGEAVGFVTCVA
jgi:hypothetical protein